jgi:hypothetical protein
MKVLTAFSWLRMEVEWRGFVKMMIYRGIRRIKDFLGQLNNYQLLTKTLYDGFNSVIIIIIIIIELPKLVVVLAFMPLSPPRLPLLKQPISLQLEASDATV